MINKENQKIQPAKPIWQQEQICLRKTHLLLGYLHTASWIYWYFKPITTNGSRNSVTTCTESCVRTLYTRIYNTVLMQLHMLLVQSSLSLRFYANSTIRSATKSHNELYTMIMRKNVYLVIYNIDSRLSAFWSNRSFFQKGQFHFSKRRLSFLMKPVFIIMYNLVLYYSLMNILYSRSSCPSQQTIKSEAIEEQAPDNWFFRYCLLNDVQTMYCRIVGWIMNAHLEIVVKK
jgi:hypothetical protein